LAIEDKNKWNKRYTNNPIPDRVIEIIEQNAGKATIGRALDIAAGMGRHSKYLAKLGFKVDALDISSLAISTLHGIENISATEVDFDSYELKKDEYDLIVCSYFLKRELFPQIVAALKKDGILIYETFVFHEDNEQAPSVRSFLLEEGELENSFKDKLEILQSKEYWHETVKGLKMKKASLVARKV
jgi:2-polyprenyl-3-methyl-5-hydroxy-6-metoxy-1,4-benzoquinol methylase